MTQDEAAARFLPMINANGQTYFKKTQVLARRATPGEIIHTFTSDGKETTNTAKEGDYVVQNQTEAKEEYILSAGRFIPRYKLIGDCLQSSEGKVVIWQVYKATGSIKAVVYDGPPTEFMAIWNESMVLKTGDTLATPDGKEVYRIASKEFMETYER